MIGMFYMTNLVFTSEDLDVLTDPEVHVQKTKRDQQGGIREEHTIKLARLKCAVFKETIKRSRAP